MRLPISYCRIRTSDKPTALPSCACVHLRKFLIRFIRSPIAQFDSLDVEEKVLENSPKEVEQIEINKKEKSGLNTEFHYNIQIHLPATTDISVYNAIFKSIKDNLM